MVSKRETSEAQILSDLVHLDDSINDLTSSINDYNGGLPLISVIESTPVLGAIIDVHLANRKCYYDSMELPQLDSEKSTVILDYISDTISKDIPAGVAAIEKKRPQFESAGLTSVVLGSLRLLEYDHDTFSEVLLEKAAPDTQPRGEVIVKAIHDAIQDGIDYFST